MKKAIFLALLAFSATARAEPYQTSPDERPYVCVTGIDAANAWDRNYHKSGSATDMVKAGTCRTITHETRLKVQEEVSTKDYFYYRVQLIDEPPSDQPLYISGPLNSPIDPEATRAARAAKPKLAPGCTEPFGGQLNRLEAGPDGQLFLKKYMVTTRCVNGQMRSFTEKLN